MYERYPNKKKKKKNPDWLSWLQTEELYFLWVNKYFNCNTTKFATLKTLTKYSGGQNNRNKANKIFFELKISLNKTVLWRK